MKRSILLCFVLLASGITHVAAASDYYVVLGVSQNASAEEIKRAYRELSMKHHPDRHIGSPAELVSENEVLFKEIGDAYSTLSDIHKRAAYDQYLSQGHAKSPRHEASSTNITIQNLLMELENADQMSPKGLNAHLTMLTDKLPALIESKNRELYRQYSRIMTKIEANPKFATLSIIKTLMRMELVQDTTFGLNPALSYWESGFDVNGIPATIGHLLQHLAYDPDVDANGVIEELIEKANTQETIQFGLRYYPKLNHWVGPYLYEFAVQKKLITDAASLIDFINHVADKIFNDTGRESISSAFLASQLEYTLSTLKNASDGDALYIISNLKQVDQGVAYEELVQSGRLSRMSIEQILEILNKARTFVDYYRENPQFGQFYTEMGEAIAARIKRANLAFTKQFQEKSPSQSQVARYIQLSDFKFGQYTWAKIQSFELPKRDYEVTVGFLPTTSSISGAANVVLFPYSSASNKCKHMLSDLEDE